MEQLLLSRPAKHSGPSTQTVTEGKAQGRLLYIDNLRWVMIMLVVSMHAAVTYSHLGSWYFMEDSPVSLAESGVFGTYQAFLQSFFMGFLFFIAGYFVPGAYDAKGPGKFLQDRAIRLGLPLLLFVFFLQPVSIYCISLFGGPDVGGSFAHVYSRYIGRSRWLGGTGPLWFCEALLIFCLGYVLFRMLPLQGGRRVRYERDGKQPLHGLAGAGDGVRADNEAGTGVGAGIHRLPGKWAVWGFIALIGIATFLVRVPWPNGTDFYNLQFCYFPQYIFFFIAGTMALRGNWLNRLPVAVGKYWGRVGLFGGLAWWVALLVLGGAFKGQLADYKGGLHWQSLGMACWEQVAGVGISLFLLVWFRERFSAQGDKARFFSANAFTVYVFHTPVLISLSRMMGGLHVPLLLKFLLLTGVSIFVTYAIAALLVRRIPLLKRIL